MCATRELRIVSVRIVELGTKWNRRSMRKEFNCGAVERTKDKQYLINHPRSQIGLAAFWDIHIF